MMLHIVLAALLATTRAFDPYQPGPHSTIHVYLPPAPEEGLNEDIDVWVPADAGLYTAFYFLDSLGGFTPGEAYDEVFNHLASHGVGIVLPWSLGLPVDPVEKMEMFVEVMAWAEIYLHEKLHYNGVQEGVVLDFENIVLGGHSAGAHVLVEYLKDGCRQVKGQVWYSPVDGVDPLGLIPNYCIDPGTPLNYVTPTLHLPVGYDSVPGGSGVACAPEKLSNMRFYDAMDPVETQKWLINVTNFGHADMLDEDYVELAESTHFCGYNPDLTLEDHQVYRKFVGGQTAAFIKALFTADEAECGTYLAYLEDPNLMTVQVDAQYNNPTGTCPKASCTWYPPTDANPPHP